MRVRGRSRPKHAIPQCLPRIPTVIGPAARLGTDVLFSALEACHPDVRPPIKAPPTCIVSTLQDVQDARQLAAHGTRVEESLSSGKTCKALFQYDSFHMLSRNAAARDFDGHDNHDGAFHEVAADEHVILGASLCFSEDVPLRPRCLPPLDSCPDIERRPSHLSWSQRSQRSQQKNEGKVKHKTTPRALERSRALSPPSESLPRLNFLRASFIHSRDEIEHRIMHMDANLGDDEEAVKFRLDTSDSCLDAYPDADLVKQAFDACQIDSMQIKPPPLMPFLSEKEQGAIPMHAERKELLLCASQLNFYRWLCGLAPAQLVRPCELMCDLVADILLPRAGPPPMTTGSHAQLAAAVSDYIGGDGVISGARAVVVHGDGSLLTAIEQSVIGHNPLFDEAILAHSNPPSQAILARDVAQKVLKRREEQGREVCNPRETMRQLSKPLDRAATLQMQLSLKPAHVFHEIPDRLKQFDYFWAMQEYGSPRKLSCVQQDRRMAIRMQRTAVVRSLPEITGRVRKEALFDPGQTERRNHKSSSFWGDTEGSIIFRRYLLNPGLEIFGAARKQETCVLWTGNLGTYDPSALEDRITSVGKRGSRVQAKGGFEDDGKFGVRDSRSGFLPAKQLPLPSPISQDAVCFPPPGYVPLELVSEPKVLWTIMPRSVRYQPTENIRVRMYRVKITAPEDGEWTADRTGEIAVSDVKIDCSSHGNPFCIIFRPEVLQFQNDDQFEVIVSGLCGERSEIMFFYHFRAFRQHLVDDCLVDKIAQLRGVLTDPNLWQDTTAYVPAQQNHSPERGSISSNKGGHAPKVNHRAASRRTVSSSDVQYTPHGPISTAQIGLVSHPNLEIHSDLADVTISLRCSSLEAMGPALYLTRVSGNEEVAHAIHVFRVSDQFIVRVKMPLASARYELHFAVSPKAAPSTLIPHALKYTIVASDVCPNLVPSLQHPLSQKFGYAHLLPTTQLNKITVISPVSYRVCLGQVYFLFHVDPDSELQHENELPNIGRSMQATGNSFYSSTRNASPLGEQDSQMNTQTSQGALAREQQYTHTSTLFSSRLSRKAGGGFNGSVEIHDALSGPMKSLCHDTTDKVHLDAFLAGEYVTRLRQRKDFPDLYEALVVLKDRDIAKRVEVFLRRPKNPGAEYAPQKLGEWLICSNEYFPPGF